MIVDVTGAVPVDLVLGRDSVIAASASEKAGEGKIVAYGPGCAAALHQFRQLKNQLARIGILQSLAVDHAGNRQREQTCGDSFEVSHD